MVVLLLILIQTEMMVLHHQYQVQVWVNDSRTGSTTNRTEVLLGAFESTVTLAFNSTHVAGGVGQFTIGSFTATATNQSFTMNGNASTQLNALQVRDLGTTALPVFTGMQMMGTNLVFVGTSGAVSGAPFYLLMSTNLATPAANWLPIATNYFGINGVFSVTNPVNPNGQQIFYRLRF